MNVQFLGVVFFGDTVVSLHPGETEPEAEKATFQGYLKAVKKFDPGLCEWDIFQRMPPREPTVRWPENRDNVAEGVDPSKL